MIRHTLAIAALLVSAPATAQSAQDELDARYDRALAAGYKALMLCSAISNAERNGATRTPESVMAWELAGIQAPLDAIMHDLPYRIVRGYAQVVPDEKPDVGSPSEELVYFDIHHVEVDWDNTSPPRFAEYHEGKGCMLGPIGTRKEQPENFIQILPYAEPRPEILSTCTPADEPKFRRNFSASVVGIADRALNGAYGQGSRTTAVVVVRNDQFLEKYADGFEFNTPQRTWSVAKSIAATLVGAAVQRGDVKPRFGLGIWSDVRRGIEIDHALRMASGLYSDTPGNRTDALYFGGATVDEVVPTWPLFNRPGTVFRYANNDTLLAVKAISQGFAAHPPSELFAKLDMNHTVAETDWRGSYILSSQVWSTARDLATLGQLYLNDGMWNGERILPEDWLEYVSRPSGPQPEGEFGYGAGFWLMNTSPGIPPDTIAAMGNRGQFIIIVPKMNVVIVRRGEDPVGSRFDIAAFTRDVLESLKE